MEKESLSFYGNSFHLNREVSEEEGFLDFFDTLDGENKYTEHLELVLRNYCVAILSEYEMNNQRIIECMDVVNKKRRYPVYDNTFERMFIVESGMDDAHSHVVNSLRLYHLHSQGLVDDEGHVSESTGVGYVDSGMGWYISSNCPSKVEVPRDHELTARQKSLFRALRVMVERR